MRKIIILILLIVVPISCSFYKQPETKSWNEDYELNIKYIPERDSDRVMLDIYSTNEYKLLMPIENILKFKTSLKSMEELQMYIKTSETQNEEIKNTKLKIIKSDCIQIEKDNTKKDFLNLNDIELFKSGMYFIYNKKNGYFVEKIRIIDEGAYNGILSAYHSFRVFVENILIWDYDVIS
jgi:hypothetical protein